MASEMPRGQLENLEKLARAATPGEWTSERIDYDDGITFEIGPMVDGSYGFRFVLRESNYDDRNGQVNIAKLKYDAAYIAAANPQVILELLSAYKAEKAQVEELKRIIDHAIFIGTKGTATIWPDKALAAAVSVLKEVRS